MIIGCLIWASQFNGSKPHIHKIMMPFSGPLIDTADIGVQIVICITMICGLKLITNVF
jgi:hypothetical protein